MDVDGVDVVVVVHTESHEIVGACSVVSWLSSCPEQLLITTYFSLMLCSLTSAVVEDEVDGEAVGHGAQDVGGGHVTAAGGEVLSVVVVDVVGTSPSEASIGCKSGRQPSTAARRKRPRSWAASLIFKK